MICGISTASEIDFSVMVVDGLALATEIASSNWHYLSEIGVTVTASKVYGILIIAAEIARRCYRHLSDLFTGTIKHVERRHCVCH